MAIKRPRKGKTATVGDAKSDENRTATSDRAANMTTAINLPVSTWELLRRVAFARALKLRGRASVSAVLVDLVEQHRKDFEKEL